MENEWFTETTPGWSMSQLLCYFMLLENDHFDLLYSNCKNCALVKLVYSRCYIQLLWIWGTGLVFGGLFVAVETLTSTGGRIFLRADNQCIFPVKKGCCWKIV